MENLDISFIESIHAISFESTARFCEKICKMPEGPEKKNAYAERNGKLRHLLEPIVYNHLIFHYGKQLNDFWRTYIPPKESKCAYCIVERRCHPNMWFILRNIAWAAPYMSVYIFCSDENLEYIHSLLGNKLPNFNIIVAFKDADAPRDEAIMEYNNFYTDWRNYEMIRAEYILTIQMDVYIRKKLDQTIFQTDYYGAPWSWAPEKPGGGGATIRRVAKMIEICKKYRAEPDNQMADCAEDVWISEKVITEGGSWPNLKERGEVFVESYLLADAAIAHQFWSFTDVYHEKGKIEFCKIYAFLLNIYI